MEHLEDKKPPIKLSSHGLCLEFNSLAEFMEFIHHLIKAYSERQNAVSGKKD